MPTVVENHKRILKNSVFLYIRMFLILVVSLYTVRIVLNCLDAVDYGIYTAIGGVVFSLSFLSQVLASASQRFFSYELGVGNYERLNKVFNTILLSYVGIALLILFLAESVGLWFLSNKMSIPANRIDAAYWVFQFSLFSFIVTILSNPFAAIIIAYEKMAVYAYVGMVEILLKLSVALLLTIASFDKLELYAFLMFIVSFIIAVVYVGVCRKNFGIIKPRFYWDRSLFKSIFSYSSWTLFGTIAGVGNNQGINVLLNVFFGPIVNAAYAVANQVSSAVSTFSNSFYTAVRPQLTKSYAAGDYAYMNQLFYFSSKTIFLLLYLIIQPLLIETPFILQLWLGEVGAYMVIFVRLILVYTTIICLGAPITTIAQAAGCVKKYHGVVDGFSLFALPLSYFIFKMNGLPEYAFYVSIGVFGVAHFIRLIVLRTIIPFAIHKYFFGVLFPMSVVICISGLLSNWSHFVVTSDIGRLIAVLMVSTISVISLSYYLLFSQEEKHIIRTLFCRSDKSKE